MRAELLEAAAEPANRNAEIFELLAQAYGGLGRWQEAGARATAGEGTEGAEAAVVSGWLVRF